MASTLLGLDYSRPGGVKKTIFRRDSLPGLSERQSVEENLGANTETRRRKSILDEENLGALHQALSGRQLVTCDECVAREPVRGVFMSPEGCEGSGRTGRVFAGLSPLLKAFSAMARGRQ